MRQNPIFALSVLALAACALLAAPAHACHDGSPLILDLDDGGIQTSDTLWPVTFDLDGDGVGDEIAWTDPHTREGILCMDLDGDGAITSGLELFGDATLLPDGTKAAHGFEALAVLDTAEMGGDGDGAITPADLAWDWLRVWIDENHDGVSQQQEISPLGRHQVVALGLDFVESDTVDPAGNRHRYEGTFLRRVVTRYGPVLLRDQALSDVFFRYVHGDEEHEE